MPAAENAFESTLWRRWAGIRIVGFVTLAAGLAGLLLGPYLLGGAIEDRLGQFVLFRLRGALPSPPEVVVVAEDRASCRDAGPAIGEPAMAALVACPRNRKS